MRYDTWNMYRSRVYSSLHVWDLQGRWSYSFIRQCPCLNHMLIFVFIFRLSMYLLETFPSSTTINSLISSTPFSYQCFVVLDAVHSGNAVLCFHFYEAKRSSESGEHWVLSDGYWCGMPCCVMRWDNDIACVREVAPPAAAGAVGAIHCLHAPSLFLLSYHTTA